jgi:hypothetical protein
MVRRKKGVGEAVYTKHRLKKLAVRVAEDRGAGRPCGWGIVVDNHGAALVVKYKDGFGNVRTCRVAL